MIKAIIFDFDGVIVDTEILNSRAYELVLKEYGKKPIVENKGTVHIVGVKGERNWEILKKKYDINEDVKILYRKKSEIYASLLPQAELMPEFQSALKSLKRLKNLKLAVATMSPIARVNYILNKFKISDAFDAALTVEDCNIPKPHPDIYLKTAEKLNISPNKCLVIEDSETGVESAKNAGMFVVAIPNKYTKGQDFSKADRVVKSFSDLTGILFKNGFAEGR